MIRKVQVAVRNHDANLYLSSMFFSPIVCNIPDGTVRKDSWNATDQSIYDRNTTTDANGRYDIFVWLDGNKFRVCGRWIATTMMQPQTRLDNLYILVIVSIQALIVCGKPKKRWYLRRWVRLQNSRAVSCIVSVTGKNKNNDANKKMLPQKKTMA